MTFLNQDIPIAPRPKWPFLVRASLLITGAYFLVSILYMAQGIILPLIYAGIVAILLSPVINFLVRKKMNRALAIALVLLIVLLLTGGFVAVLASQAGLLRQAWPQLIVKLKELLSQSEIWASGYFNVSPQKMDSWVREAAGALMKNRDEAIGTSLTTIGGILAATVLTPVYIFMALFYQPHILAFAHMVFGAANDEKVSEILTETKTIVKGYITGLFGEFVIIAILNSIGLLVLRIDYAILLGVIGAVLNVIPIIGGVICVGLFVIMALLTKTPVYILYVLGLYAVIQFIDDHYIFPKIVGSKVKLNLLVSIVAVIAGDALWGIPGMFLAIPLTAVLKLFLDRIDPMKPWGFLLGDGLPAAAKMKFSFLIKGFIPAFGEKKTSDK